MSEESGTFVFGEEDNAVELKDLEPAKGPYELTIFGTPIIEGNDDGTGLRLSVLLQAESEPLAKPVFLRMFLPDKSKGNDRMYNDNLLKIQQFKQAFGWTPPVGQMPFLNQEFPELSGQRAWANLKVKKDKSGQYDDEVVVKAWVRGAVV